MRRRWLLGALALTGACGDEAGGGGTVLAGSYAGSLSPRGTCSDGSMVPSAAIAADVTLFQVGNRVRWEMACGATAMGTVTGAVATLEPATCLPTFDRGTSITQTLRGGTLTRVGNQLVVDLSLRSVGSGAATGSCDSTLTGTLVRH